MTKPIPVPRRPMRYPWQLLKKGGDLFLPGATINSARTAAKAWFDKRGVKVMLAARSVDGGVTIYRIK